MKLLWAWIRKVSPYIKIVGLSVFEIAMKVGSVLLEASRQVEALSDREEPNQRSDEHEPTAAAHIAADNESMAGSVGSGDGGVDEEDSSATSSDGDEDSSDADSFSIDYDREGGVQDLDADNWAVTVADEGIEANLDFWNAIVEQD